MDKVKTMTLVYLFTYTAPTNKILTQHVHVLLVYYWYCYWWGAHLLSS